MRVLKAVLATIALSAVAAVPAWAGIIVNNGPINGNLGGPFINFGYSVADSFQLSNTATITGFVFGTWTISSDVPQTVGWQVTSSAPFTGSVVGGAAAVNLTSTFLFTNSSGFDIYRNFFPIANMTLPAGSYWFQLGNALSSQGLPVLWDLNNGPASAFQFDGVTISPLAYTGSAGEAFSASEAFSIQAVPEPNTMTLLGCSILLVAFLYRKTH